MLLLLLLLLLWCAFITNASYCGFFFFFFAIVNLCFLAFSCRKIRAWFTDVNGLTNHPAGRMANKNLRITSWKLSWGLMDSQVHAWKPGQQNIKIYCIIYYEYSDFYQLDQEPIHAIFYININQVCLYLGIISCLDHGKMSTDSFFFFQLFFWR